jgi:hypothetical protein
MGMGVLDGSFYLCVTVVLQWYSVLLKVLKCPFINEPLLKMGPNLMWVQCRFEPIAGRRFNSSTDFDLLNTQQPANHNIDAIAPASFYEATIKNSI